MCTTVVNTLVGKLAGKASCAAIDVDAAATCAAVNIEDGDLLWPLCEAIVVGACPMIIGYIVKHETANFPEIVCQNGFHLCPGGSNAWTFCGCLPAGQCVDPITAPGSTCCSGKWRLNGLLEHCGKDYHNLAAPAQCE